jgi:hypothetical protein
VWRSQEEDAAGDRCGKLHRSGYKGDTVRSSTSFVLGIVVGALAVVLGQRLREVVAEEDAEAIADRLTRQIQLLEERTMGAVGTLEGSPTPA